MPYGDDIFQDTSFRFLDKERNCAEINNFDGWWEEQIRHYGVSVDYYVSNFSVEDHDKLYGEDPTAVYSESETLILAPVLNENAVVLQNIGLMADDELTAFIHMETYRRVFGETAEPKSGDVFDLEEFGRSRFNGRTGKKFEITERLDQDVNQINQLMGHYVWLIKAKRYDYSYEPGLSPEGASEQITDDVFEGLMPGGSQGPSPDKTVPGSADEESNSIFDYSQYGDGDDVYGDYT